MTEMAYHRSLTAEETISVFRIERVLGAGGFGITYLATDTSLNVQVAIKEYFPQNAWRDSRRRTVQCYAGEAEESYQVGLQRFREEGQTLAQFKHPNIVRVRQMLSANNTAYLVMDYEQGEELETHLRHLGRPLVYQEVEEIFNPLLDGLRAVHDRGLLHLDIKPENVFLRADSTPILIDFGGARHQLGQASRQVSFLVASDGYAPNEQYVGTLLQPSTDIYAVGASIYRSISGKVPIDAQKRGMAMIDGGSDPLTSIRRLVSHDTYPEHFLQAVEDALNMRVSDRPQSLRELQHRLFQAAHAISSSHLDSQIPSAIHKTQKPATILNNKSKKLTTFFFITGAVIFALTLFWVLTNYKIDLKLEQLPIENQPLASQLDNTSPNTSNTKQPQSFSSSSKTKALPDNSSDAPHFGGINQRDQTPILTLIQEYTIAAGQNDFEAPLQFYTELTDFYNKKSANHDFILKESKRYASVYHDRSFQVVSLPDLTWLSDDVVLATFKMSYSVCCKTGKGPAQGVSLINMRLVRTKSGWKINVVNSKKID